MLRRARLRQGDEPSFRCSPSMPHSSRRLLPRCFKGERPACFAPCCGTLGFGGPGWEESIAAYVADSDEQTAREALRALARVGTPKAASLVVAEIEQPARECRRRGGRNALALSRQRSAAPHSRAAGPPRLHDEAPRGDRAIARSSGARPGLAICSPCSIELAPMRFRIWNPALARVARKAHAMLKTPQQHDDSRLRPNPRSIRSRC